MLEKNKHIVFIGSSTTDCDRARPLGEGLFGAYGNGYVNLINSLFVIRKPEKLPRITNMGTNGNTVKDLEKRLESDVLALNPDILVIMIGANDVWRQFDLPQIEKEHVYLKEYEEAYSRIIEKTIKHGIDKILLITPYFIENSKEDKMLKMMGEYEKKVIEIGEKYKLPVVKTQPLFNYLLKYFHSSFISWDRIHPSTSGHLMLAEEIFKKLDNEYF